MNNPLTAINEERKRLGRVELVCAECGVVFHTLKHKKRLVCGVICRNRRIARSNQERYRAARPVINCKHCGAEFESTSRRKMFCSLACFKESDHFMEAMARVGREKSEAIKLLKGLNRDDEPLIVCLNCSKVRKVRLTRVGSQKFCDTKCYREYMAERFDRYIANPESLALPQNYDEFLTQDELPCLIEGCEWRGVYLAVHINAAHGITKDRAKELGGFNKTTGLVPAHIARQMSERQAAIIAPLINEEWLARLSSDFHNKGGTMRLEGKEHLRKARALQKVKASHIPKEG